jgi:hypothetical protein
MMLTEQKEWVLKINDRCDTGDCPAQATVRVTGVTGSLDFCGHHYYDIMNNEFSRAKMEAFAFETIDEREKFNVNRLIGDN